MHNLHIYPDTPALIDAAAQRWAELSQTAIKQHACFHVALSGGTTPAALYHRLCSAEWIDKIEWQKVHIWFGDERNVPPDHPDSNYRMARETLLNHAPIPEEQIHPMRGEMDDPTEAAEQYGRALSDHVELVQDIPRFDLIMLGIGTDGHIASLFPGSRNLSEQHKTVSAAWIDEQKGWRISLTLPTIINAAQIMLIANGEGKSTILQQVFGDISKKKPLPATFIRDLPQAEWLLDAAAAKGITPL